MVTVRGGPLPEEISDQEDRFAHHSGSSSERVDDQSAEDTIHPSVRQELHHKEADAARSDEISNSPPDNKTQPSRRIARFFGAHKKGIAIGTLVGGGSIGAIIAGFLWLAPLKVVGIVSHLELFYGSSNTLATDRIADNFISKYIGSYVLPGINNRRCHSTIEPTCVANVAGDGPVARMYKAWRQSHIETIMAKQGVVFGRDSKGLYMAVKGESVLGNEDLLKVVKGEASIFDVGTRVGSLTESSTLREARAALRAAFKDASLWDRFFTRFQAGKLLEVKYGVKRCIVACNIRDNFHSAIADKKLAAQAAIINRVISPISDRYGIIIACVISDATFCDTLLKSFNPTTDTILDPEKLSPFQQNLQTQMAEFVTEHGIEELHEAVETAHEIAEKGIANQIIVKALTPILGETGAKVGAEAIPIVGWVLLAAQVIHAADKLGPTIRVMSYAINANAMVTTYTTYSTVASETKSGHMDATELGSFNQSLSTNLTGSKTDQADATSTPLYHTIFGYGTSSSAYTCNDGSHVPSGQLVCPEEKLDRGNQVADDITNGLNVIPGLAGLAGIINKANDFIGLLLGGAFEGACHAVDVIPPGNGCTNVVNAAGQHISQFSSWLINKVIASPFTDNMSGGRTFDMIAGGADVANNKVCQLKLGCAKLTDQQVADIRSTQLNEQKREFEQQPLFARLFSTDSPFSLATQIATVLPSTLPQATHEAAIMLLMPFNSITSLVSNILSGDKLSAASLAHADPFGVVQYGYLPNQIPDDPQAYWDAHCQGDFATTWANSQQQDPNTGEPLATTPEPCILIQSMAESAGGAFDPTLLPSGSLNPDN